MKIRDWDGTTISEPGIYRGIPLEDYHNNTTLLSGPSVSKSNLKHIAPPDGSPKRFWANWAQNPRRVGSKKSRALDFGKAVHCLFLGDEVFDDRFIVRPEKVDGEAHNKNRTVWRQWYAEQDDLGLTVISQEDIEQIKRMRDDAAEHELVRAGGLNGEVELSMFARDPATGIWLKSRPDVKATDGMYVDLKTAGSLDAEFLERQLGDMGYYIQGALTKMVCDLLGLPFISFTFLYCLTDEYADTDFRVLGDDDIAIGEATIRYGLHHIRRGLDTGQWDGARIYTRENVPIRITSWTRTRIITALQMEGFLP